MGAADDDIMTLQKQKAMSRHSQKMQKLLRLADTGGDGQIALEELSDVITRPEVRVWLLAQEIDIRDVEMLYQLLDVSSNGEVSIEELTKGLAYLKGSARSIDVCKLMYNQDSICQALNAIYNHIFEEK